MIVSEVMATKLVTVTPNDTLSHAANLLRQHQFHHLPVVQTSGFQQRMQNLLPVLEGVITSQDIDVAAAAQILVERGLNYLPVVEYEQAEQGAGDAELETRPVLVGLLTRSDLLIALARILGALEPGMQLVVLLPTGNLAPLTQTLQLTEELHIPVRSVLVAPKEGSTPHVATVRLGTMNPAPLLVRLQKANIEYIFADPIAEGGTHV
jgi:acetoin utilization protein AcuB